MSILARYSRLFVGSSLARPCNFSLHLLDTFAFNSRFIFLRSPSQKEALRCYTISRCLQRERLGDIDKKAGVLVIQQKLDDVEKLYKQFLVAYSSSLGENNPEIISATSRLAKTINAKGKYSEAECLFKECIAKQIAQLGESHIETLLSLNDLAMCYYNQRKFADAKPLLIRVADFLQSRLGESNPQTIVCRLSLASTLAFLREYSEALPMYTRAINITASMKGPSRVLFVKAIAGMADTCHMQGNFEDATMWYRNCLDNIDKDRAILGAEAFPQVQHATKLLLDCLARQRGNFDEVVLLYECQLKKLKAVFGEHNFQTYALSTAMIDVCYRFDQVDRGDELFKTILDNSKHIGLSAQQIIESILTLGKSQAASNQMREAIAICSSCARMSQIALGDYDQYTLHTRLLLGTVYLNFNKLDLAEVTFRGCFDNCITSPNGFIHHSIAVAASRHLSDLYIARGTPSEAEALYSRFVQVMVKFAGESHLDTITVMTFHASVLWSTGNYSRAEAILRDCLETCQSMKQTAGNAGVSAVMARILHDLGSGCVAQARLDEARTFYAQALALNADLYGESDLRTLDARLSCAKVAAAQQGEQSATEAENALLAIIDAANSSDQKNNSDVAVGATSRRIGAESMLFLGNLYHSRGSSKATSQLAVALNAAHRFFTSGDARFLNQHRATCMINDLRQATLQLTDLYIQSGDFRKAESVQRQEMLLLATLRGDMHPDVFASWLRLIDILCRDGSKESVQAAESLVDGALVANAGKPVIAGAATPIGSSSAQVQQLFNALLTLGCGYTAQARFKEAAQVLDPMLRRAKHWLGPNHPDTLLFQLTAGSAHVQVGSIDTAEELINDCERQWADHGALRHKSAFLLSTVAMVHAARGRVDEAIGAYERCLESANAFMASSHNSMGSIDSDKQTQNTEALSLRLLAAKAENELGLLLIKKGGILLAKAVTMLSSSLAKHSQLCGADHLDVAIIRTNLALAYSALGDLGKAEAELQAGLEKIRSILGSDHLVTLNSMMNLALLYVQQHRIAQAIAIFQLCVEGLQQTLGVDHPNTKLAWSLLNDTRQRL